MGLYMWGEGGGRGENAGEGKLRNYSYQLIFSFLHGVDLKKLIFFPACKTACFEMQTVRTFQVLRFVFQLGRL